MVIRSDRVLHRQLGDEAVLYQLDTEQIAALDAVGSVVWECLGFPGTLAELVADLAEAYDVAPEQVSQDIDSLIARLVDLGMVLVNGQGPPAPVTDPEEEPC